MPMYEFHCTRCDEDFEELVRAGDSHDDVSCPSCGDTGATRKLSAFAVSSAGGGYGGGYSSGASSSGCGSSGFS